MRGKLSTNRDTALSHTVSVVQEVQTRMVEIKNIIRLLCSKNFSKENFNVNMLHKLLERSAKEKGKLKPSKGQIGIIDPCHPAWLAMCYLM